MAGEEKRLKLKMTEQQSLLSEELGQEQENSARAPLLARSGGSSF